MHCFAITVIMFLPLILIAVIGSFYVVSVVTMNVRLDVYMSEAGDKFLYGLAQTGSVLVK